MDTTTLTQTPATSSAQAKPRPGQYRRPLRIATVLVAVALLLAAMLALLPARWVVNTLSIPGPLLGVEAHGTLWSGSAQLSFGQPELRQAVPGTVRWRLGFADGPHLDVTHPALEGQLRLDFTGKGLRASAQSAQLPATLLGGLHPSLNRLAPEGDLQLRWPATDIGESAAPPVGNELLDIRWNRAVSGLSEVRPIGAYRVGLTQRTGGEIGIVLTTTLSPLFFEGHGTYTSEQGLRLDATAYMDIATTSEARAALQDLLSAIGATRRGDLYPLSLR